MTLEPSRLLLALKEPLPPRDLERRLENAGFVLEVPDPERANKPRPVQEVVNHTETRFWIRTRSDAPVDDALWESLEKSFEGLVDWIGPVYRLDNTSGRDGMLCPLPNVLVIRPAGEVNSSSRAALSRDLSKYGIEQDAVKSKYLGDFEYFLIPDPNERDAYQLRETILENEGSTVVEVLLENMPMLQDYCVSPNDPLFPQQWGMTQIQAGGPGVTGWDITTGVGGVVVAVLDTGCDLTHPDVTYSPLSINLGSMAPGSGGPVAGGGHGTSCAGIVAGTFNNALGVAGVAGGCTIMALARQNSTDVEVALGINYAAANGARVISMSFGRYASGEGFGPTGWNFALIDPAIANAVIVSGLVLCAATGNEDTGTVNRYPARHALVIACGASDQVDNRKTTTSPDGEAWGSNFGTNVHLGVNTGVSVVAPGVLIPTTDIQGAGGFNTSAGTAGDFVVNFNGTSSATPHVAGLAALIFSECPSWTNIQVRDRIEQSVDKVGTLPYAAAAGFPNGTRNQEMGYGRINVLRALQKTTPVINWSPAALVYGTPLSAGQLNASSPVAGSFVYAQSVGACLPAGPQTLTVTFTPTDTCTFASVTTSVTLNVAKATPLISWANPPAIDQADGLPASALNATSSWTVCGVTGPVLGTFNYNHAPGDILPVGLITLSVTFLPTDTANFNPATATVQINVLTGYPITLSCIFAPTTLPREERVQVTVVVKNDSIKPHSTQGPNPGFEYSEGDTFLTGARPGRESFPGIADAYRIAVDLDMTPYPYTQRYLYRWGFGHTLAPGEIVTVNGFIRMHNSRQNAPYYVAMIREINNVVLDHQCTTMITVLRP